MHPPPGSSSIRQLRTGAVWIALGALLLASPGLAQDPARPPKIDAQKLMHYYMLGRYRMPVTCTRPDGTLLEREEAVVFRSANDKAGFPVIRATFFGVHAPDADRCYNLVTSRLPDRRGSLYLTFEAHYRPDLGMRDFRRILDRGPIEFHVLGGQLEIRDFDGEEAGAVRRVQFDRGDAKLVIATIPRLSDGDKLLGPIQHAQLDAGSPPRRFELRIEGQDGFSLRGFYEQDRSRRP